MACSGEPTQRFVQSHRASWRKERSSEREIRRTSAAQAPAWTRDSAVQRAMKRKKEKEGKKVKESERK